MSYSIVAIPNFKRDLKKLSKKFPSLKDDFANFIEILELNPKQGTSLGNNCYKIRMAIASKGKGKSGGSRIVTYVIDSESLIYLLSIYDKSDKENISNKELKELLKYID